MDCASLMQWRQIRREMLSAVLSRDGCCRESEGYPPLFMQKHQSSSLMRCLKAVKRIGRLARRGTMLRPRFAHPDGLNDSAEKSVREADARAWQIRNRAPFIQHSARRLTGHLGQRGQMSRMSSAVAGQTGHIPFRGMSLVPHVPSSQMSGLLFGKSNRKATIGVDGSCFVLQPIDT